VVTAATAGAISTPEHIRSVVTRRGNTILLASAGQAPAFATTVVVAIVASIVIPIIIAALVVILVAGDIYDQTRFLTDGQGSVVIMFFHQNPSICPLGYYLGIFHLFYL